MERQRHQSQQEIRGSAAERICCSTDHSWKPGLQEGSVDDYWGVVTDRSGAHEWRTADPLGCARDDKKERTVARRGRFLNRDILKI